MSPRVIRYCLLVALCYGSGASLASPRQHARPAEILVMGGNLFGVGPPAPLRQLCLALTKHPAARLFRVTWDSNGPGSSHTGVALYDRRRKSLKLVSYISWNIDGEKSTEFKEVRDEWIFTDVSDAKLRRLHQKYAIDFDSADAMMGYFPRLRELGCKQQQLRHLAQSHREKL